MEQEAYLGHYRICRDANGSPVMAISGGGGTTYKAEDTRDGRDIFLQVVPVIGLSHRVREKLEAEAAAAKKISHANVPALLDFGVVGNEFVYATEYFEGTSAQTWIAEQGALPIGDVLRIATQAVGALAAANFHGIVHHALHPGNVMLLSGQTPEGEWPLIKVTNFLGLAPSLKTVENAGSGLHDPVNYASPEQLQGRKVDFRSEVYSLGGTLWFLLTGVPPFAGAVTVDNAPGVPTAIKELISQMLATDPAERQFDPVTLQGQIDECIAQINRRDALASKVGLAPAAVAAAPEVIASETRPARSWKPLAIAALLLFAVAVAAVVLPSSLSRGRLSARDTREIGVPIGIPEASPAIPASQVAPSGPAPISPDNPPVLVSNASADDDAADDDSAKKSEQVAANEAPAAPVTAVDNSPPQQPAPKVTDAARVTAQTSEPPPHAEPSAPAATSAHQSSSIAESGSINAPRSAPPNPEPASSPHTVSQESAPVATESPAAKKPPRVAKSKTRVKRAERVYPSLAEDDLPPIPRHAVRAQYLGTTPDGEMVFGVPSSQRYYLPPEERRRERSRRRSRQIIRDEIEAGAALPVLPPEDDDDDD